MVVRRFVTLVISFCLVLAMGIARVDQLFAQGEAKKDTPAPKIDTPTKETAKAGSPTIDSVTKPEPPKAPEATRPTEPPLPPIPPEVKAKIDAARRAVAEAIVAAQDAGLVETSIDPPPILDILIDGRATDTRTLKNSAAKKPYMVSPEVFGAWFTGYGKLDGINYVDDVRIINPSAGLKQFYDQRARFLEQCIQEIRKTKPVPAAKKDEPKSTEPYKTDAKKVNEPPKGADEKKN